MTVALVALSLWYIVMVISYCCVVRHRRRQNRLIQEDECDSLSK